MYLYQPKPPKSQVPLVPPFPLSLDCHSLLLTKVAWGLLLAMMTARQQELVFVSCGLLIQEVLWAVTQTGFVSYVTAQALLT